MTNSVQNYHTAIVFTLISCREQEKVVAAIEGMEKRNKNVMGRESTVLFDSKLQKCQFT